MCKCSTEENCNKKKKKDLLGIFLALARQKRKETLDNFSSEIKVIKLFFWR